MSPTVFIIVLLQIVTVIILMWHFEPRYAQKHILVWLTMCSIISSMTVIACRGFASMVTQVHCLIPRYRSIYLPIPIPEPIYI